MELVKAGPIEDWSDLSVALGAGVYALLFADNIVYIGKAKQLLSRIYAHRNMLERQRASRRDIKAVRFSKVKVWPCSEFDLDRLEKELIVKYKPKYNVHHTGRTESVMLNIGGIAIALGGATASDRRDL